MHESSKTKITDFHRSLKEHVSAIENKQIVEEVRVQFAELYSDYYPSSKQYKFMKQSAEKLGEKLERATGLIMVMDTAIRNVIDGIEKSLDKQEGVESEVAQVWQSKALMDALNYLVTVELLGTLTVDITILMLVGKGYDLHLEPDSEHRYTRHVTSLEDLESPAMSLSQKLDFLHSNGLTVFTKYIDRVLRNKIAHLEFHIDEKGSFFLRKGKRKKKVNLMAKFLDLTQFSYIVNALFLRNSIRRVETKPK